MVGILAPDVVGKKKKKRIFLARMSRRGRRPFLVLLSSVKERKRETGKERFPFSVYNSFS